MTRTIDAQVYEFDDVRVDCLRVEVTRGGQPVPLEPKTFDVLKMLLDHRERLVTKDELLDTVWKDTVTTPNVLTRAVAQLRKALADDPFEPKYIETVAKRGYRFIAPVQVRQSLHQSTGTDAAVTPVRWRRPFALPAIGGAMLLVAALSAVIVARRTAPVRMAAAASPASVTPPRRFSVGNTSYQCAAVSPDGRRIAYTSEESGAPEMYVRGIAAYTRDLQITHDGLPKCDPAWSPDGQWLAFVWKKSIWIVSAVGGTPRKVTDGGSRPEWSPDGRRLVYSSFAGAMTSQAALWTIGIDGSDPRPLTRLGVPAGGHVAPCWSHDGRWIAFTVANGTPQSAIWQVSSGGGQPRLIASGRELNNARFSPDDRAIYLSGASQSGDALMRVRLDGSGAAVGPPETLMPFVGALINRLSIAADGTAVVTALQYAANIWAVDVRSELEPSEPFQLTFDDVRDTNPDFSPDGRHVAFQQQIAGQPTAVWVVNAEGTRREPLSVGSEDAFSSPRWSADGARVFVVIEKQNRHEFGWVTVATQQLTRFSAFDWAPPESFPRLSPDGREVAFHVIDAKGGMNVWRQQITSGARAQLTFDEEAATYPSWSRDGKWLAVVLKRGEETHVGVVSHEGGPVEQITFEHGQSWAGGWAPDNDRIAFAGQRDDVWNLYAVSRRTRRIRKLTSFSDAHSYVRFPTWSPRGDRIAFERAAGKMAIWTLNVPVR